MMAGPCRTIIWDWNGTLLDDVDCCVSTLNVLRARRGMAEMPREEYRRRFGFPVRAFYEEIGFDFSREDFSVLSQHFISEYCGRHAEMRLASDAPSTLDRLRARGVRHVVISAMESGLLGEMLGRHGLLPVLAGFHGRPDHHAGSKVEIGAAAARQQALDPNEVIVVGDTLHDLELASAIGCRAVLYAGGHQSRERLAAAGPPVIDSLAELEQHID